MSGILDELAWRGLISQTTDEAALRAALNAGPVTLYCGFDPTAPSLHLGNLMQILTVRRFQDAGHRPLMLVGGATGLIGDPRDAGERSLNPAEVVEEWVGRIRAQIEPLMSFEGASAARMVNNYEWTASLDTISFLRDVGKHFRLGTMISKDTVARRLASDEGISFTEFAYQVLQGMDFLELYRRFDCTLQTGGSDQWGNLLSGTDLIRKAEGITAHALTTPLMVKTDGSKFGKTAGGSVWLDPEMTSPYAFYQFWLNADDADVVTLLKYFTFRSREEIEALGRAVADEPFKREAQRALAEDVTALVHGSAALGAVQAASQAIFGRGELAALDAATLAGVADSVPSAEVATGTSLVDALVAIGLVESRSEARRAIADGGAYLNNQTVLDPEFALTASAAIAGGWAVVRRGKKTVGLVRIGA
jgi:tyrosyl-tRNA synthetase